MPVGLTVPGRLGDDPELRSTSGGQVANFSVAVSGYDRVSKEKTTTWVRVTMWGVRGEQIAKLVSKGDAVCFIGTGELKSYEKRDGGEVWYLECTASECVLMGSSQKSDEPREKQPPKPASNPAHRGRVKEADFDDDDKIPF